MGRHKGLFYFSIFFLFMFFCVGDVSANTTEGNKMADLGAKLACTDNNPIIAYRPETRIYDDRTRRYVDAREQATPLSISEYVYASCDITVSTIVRYSGVDKDFEPTRTPAQWIYLNNSTDKWERIGTYKCGQSTTKLQPGDVMLTDWSVFPTGMGHIWMYLGNKAVQKYWPGSDSDSVEGSYCSYPQCSLYPDLFNAEKKEDKRLYVIYRYKGHSDVEAIVRWAKTSIDFGYISSSNEINACNLISGELANMLTSLFQLLCVVGIVLVVILTIIDLLKIITSADAEGISKFLPRLTYRIITIIILLVLPFLITLLINFINKVAPDMGFNSSNPLCSVSTNSSK